uniref:Predicted protein n=1 Tax=Hordeum vulgare subsp. vulgare TaxID=112509 RepID=F2D324_HORVV|nr:predicted protein [Hordeum vulgare subsp. vulgare]
MKGCSPSSSVAPLTASNGCDTFSRARAYPERNVWCPMSPTIITRICLCSLSMCVLEEGDEPNRLAPPVGEPASLTVGAPHQVCVLFKAA